VQIEPVGSYEAAIGDAEVAITSTNARAPFFDAAWLRPGMHLSCMQRDEASDDCFRRADVVVIHTRAMEQNYSSTEFAEVEQRTGVTIRDHPLQRGVDWKDYPDLAELVSGKAPGRTSDDQITLFVNSIGVAAQFAAIGQLIYHKARGRGLGRELPIDWFVESVHP
jgi:alanine dehydrogenase